MIKRTYVFESPLSVPVGKDKFILNLNNYRNAHFQKLNKAKQKYNSMMASQLLNRAPHFKKITIEYVVYHGTRGIIDTANVASIHAKFFCDAMTNIGLIDDDNFNFVVGSSERFGGYDKENPRVDVFVTEVSDEMQ